ncbi:MAG: response regulator transcription factor [Saprospiraceae bacterium]|jgi:two-component system alkaline phosphatase synthesis response regulator PhoP|nr:response regulator transcription factor [Saprospiraceae bacterium]
MHRILLVEDEENIRKAIAMNLELEQFEVVATESGKKALEYVSQQHFDLLILDIMLPDVDGISICEQVRLQNRDVAIMILSAKDTPYDRILGLKTGADDYLTKPFHLEELLLRVRKLLQRTQTGALQELDLYSIGKTRIDFKKYEISGTRGLFHLTKKEALLLRLLIDRQNEVVSRNQILQTVWGYDVYPSTRTIDNFILSFRKYFEDDPREPRFFHSIRGVGYKFTP